MTTATADGAPALKCRYRYATGCAAEFGSKPGLGAHEKQSGAHAAHRVELRVCPECGTDCGGEMDRAVHLSAEHGVRAGSERRQELDARQVLELLGARPAAAHAADAPEPGRESEPEAAAAPTAATPPADLLSAARDSFDALADEVEALRAENAALRAENAGLAAEAATFATVRTLLAGQNGSRVHATAP